MNLLIDTHAILWYINGDSKLPAKVIEIINNVENKCFISMASIWEIAIKLSLDKLEIKGGFQTIENFLNNNDFETLPISVSDIKILLNLEFIHRDPFDRILIAQSLHSNLTIISKDKFFDQYAVKVLW